MLKEVFEYLNVQKDKWFIDCNLGGGGHTQKILEMGGRVIGIDLDPESISEVSFKLKKYIESEALILFQSNFVNLDDVITEASQTISGIKVSGILFDLGTSAHQLEKAERGFSFNLDAPLDMRMNPTNGASAKDLVNGLHEKELFELFLRLGEEKLSRPIAKKIVEYRKIKPIESTNELANIILSVKRRSQPDRTHPATKIFQALRIAVNDELNSLKEALPKALEILEPEGRIVVISFHSLEDRIVKNYFRDWSNEKKVKILTKNPIETSNNEIAVNPRSRSAKLRAIEKTS